MSNEQLSMRSETFPFADGPAIVRAHQKDSYFESVVKSKIQEVIQIYQGQRFVNLHPEEIGILAKVLYLSLTTLRGSKTLGEEYTDLIYVNRKGTKLPRLFQRIGFIISYLILPYTISRILNRILKKIKPNDDKDDDELSEKIPNNSTGWLIKWLSNINYKNTMDTLLNLHISLFYLRGKYYQLSKRFFGLRYVFGHSVNGEVNNGSYEVLGAMIIIQFFFKAINKFNDLTSSETDSDESDPNALKDDKDHQVLYGMSQTTVAVAEEICLSNPKSLPYISEASRKCMLCLEYMRTPSLAPCGHCFCWICIIDWTKERQECPLCRQAFLQQQVITLR